MSIIIGGATTAGLVINTIIASPASILIVDVVFVAPLMRVVADGCTECIMQLE